MRMPVEFTREILKREADFLSFAKPAQPSLNDVARVDHNRKGALERWAGCPGAGAEENNVSH